MAAAPSHIVLALAAFFCLAQAATVPPKQYFDVEKVVKEFQESIDKSVAEVKKNLNLPEHPNGASIVKLIHEQSNKAEKTLADLKKNIEESVKKNTEIDGYVKKLQSKIDEGRNLLKEKDPNAAASLQKFADTVKQVYESVGKEFAKIKLEANKKGGFHDDFDGLLKLFIDRGAVVSKDFQVKVEEIVKQVNS